MDVEFRQTKLPNGLTIVGEANPNAHTSAVGIYARVGTRDEPVSWMGVSHFLEHMMFKGTPTRTADEVNCDFDRIGANHNAATSQDATSYYAHVMPEYLPKAIELLTDILRPTLLEDDFEMERKVILEEIAQYDDRPYWTAFERAVELYFGDNPLGYRVLGTQETVSGLSLEVLHDYFTRAYGADNMIVSLAGNVDFDRCVDQIIERCGDWHSTGLVRHYPKVCPEVLEETIRDPRVNRFYYVAMGSGPCVQDDQRYAAAVLSAVLGDDDGSRLFWDLVDTGLADEAEFAHQGYDHDGTFVLYASGDPTRAEQIEATMHETIKQAVSGITEDEVERARNKIATSLTIRDELPMGRMSALAGQYLYLGEYRSLDEELGRLMSVDVAELNALIEAFPLTFPAAVRVLPES